MHDEIIKAVIDDGVQISLSSDRWPLPGRAGKIRISMTKQTWNGIRTMNRTITREEIAAAEKPEELLNQKVRKMAEIIDSTQFYD